MAGAPPPNFANRTMWTRDNLDVLRGLNSESVDLVYADPPFNSNKNYEAPIGSKAAGAAFKDTWTLSDVDVAWHGEIADREPKVYAAIDGLRDAASRGTRTRPGTAASRRPTEARSRANLVQWQPNGCALLYQRTLARPSIR